MGYIYKIENKINDKCYIGKTLRLKPEDRWKEHIRDMCKERCKNRPLYRAMNKYGTENFRFSILEQTSSKEINNKEKEYIIAFNSYKTGYNATKGGDGAGYIDEEEVCKLYKKLQTKLEVAKILGCHADTVGDILRRNDILIVTGQDIMSKRLSLKVNQYDLDMNFIKTHDSLSNAARELGVNRKRCSEISTVCKGKRKQAFGYKWQYAE